MSPILEEIALDYQAKVKVEKLNVDENPKATSQHGIRSIPTLIIFKNGRPADKIAGAFPQNYITKAIEGVLNKSRKQQKGGNFYENFNVCSKSRSSGTNKGFTEVTKSFEQQLGKFDIKVVESLSVGSLNAETAKSEIEKMVGKSGFMLFGTVNHGLLLSTFGKNRKAIQYVIGNPLIAIQMTQHKLAAGLYAPLRALIYDDDKGKTHLEYDKPSSLFDQFGDDKIISVANMLDHKLEDLVRVATECRED